MIRFKMFLPVGFDRNRQFLSPLPCASANHPGCSERSPFKPMSYHWSSFALNWQGNAEAECHPWSSRLFHLRIGYIQTCAGFQYHGGNDIFFGLTIKSSWPYCVDEILEVSTPINKEQVRFCEGKNHLKWLIRKTTKSLFQSNSAFTWFG